MSFAFAHVFCVFWHSQPSISSQQTPLAICDPRSAVPTATSSFSYSLRLVAALVAYHLIRYTVSHNSNSCFPFLSRTYSSLHIHYRRSITFVISPCTCWDYSVSFAVDFLVLCLYPHHSQYITPHETPYVMLFSF